MKTFNFGRVSLIFVVVALALLLVTTAAFAAGSMEIPWWSATGSGGTAMTGGNYSVSGIAGQPYAGVAMSGGAFSLESGFLHGATATIANFFIYLPQVVR